MIVPAMNRLIAFFVIAALVSICEPASAIDYTQLSAVKRLRAEKRYDEIAWANSILHAEEVAARSNRPMFLFTYNGNLDTGRC